jgi:hypothetical protein
VVTGEIKKKIYIEHYQAKAYLTFRKDYTHDEEP